MSEDKDHANPKPPSLDRLSQLWHRISDHRMVQWSVAYVALAYGIQHGVTLTSEAFEWPHAVERISMLLLVLGLPVVMTLAWYHGARAGRRISGPELSIISILLVIGAGLFYVFARPHEEITTAPRSAVQQASLAAGSGTPSGISIAVLPFANMSGDAGQEFFSDGMTEEINGALAKVADLHVVARTSAFQFKGQNQDVRAVGQALGASHLIEGSVRKAGDRVRITAQLVRADNGLQLWSESYDRELKDIFATQEDIAQAIAGALQVPLGLRQGETLVGSRTGDLASYGEYLRARALFRTRGTGVGQAATILEKVVAPDPNYAPAWALLALTYDLTPIYHPAWFGGSVDALRRVVDASLPRAETAARRAIQLDPKNAGGYVSLAVAQAWSGKLLPAEDLFKQSLALDPNDPDALHQYATLLANVGRMKEALAMRQRLQALEPFVPVFSAQTALILWLNGQDDTAITLLKDLPPGGTNRAPYLARIYAAAGRYGEAADVLSTIPPESYPPGMVAAMARLLRTAPATAALPQGLPALGNLEFVYLYLGAPNRVLEFYEGNVESGYWGGAATSSLWHPSYAPVRKMKRFNAYVRNAGLVAYWRERGWPEFCHPTTGDDFACN